MSINPPGAMGSVTVMLIFLAVAILAVYLICMLLILARRAKRLVHSQNKKYFLSILLYLFSKLIICGILTVQVVIGIANQWADLTSGHVEIMFKNSLILGDTAIITLFLLALQFHFKLSFQALNGQQELSAKWPCRAIRLIQVAILSSMLIPLVLFDMEMVSFQVMNAIAAAFNCIAITCFLVSFFYMNFKMTGIMLEMKLHQAVKRIYKLLLIVLVSRVLMATFEISIAITIPFGTFEEFVRSIDTTQDDYVIFAVVFISILVITLLTEGIPVMYSMRGAIIDAMDYICDPEDLITTTNTILKETLLDGQDSHPEDEQEMSLSRFSKMQEMENGRGEEGIWKMKRGWVGKEEFVIRISKYEISSYILEDIETEVARWTSLRINAISKVSYFCDKGILHLIEPTQTMNLDELVDQKTNTEELLKIILKIALAVGSLHEREIAHGCLKPSHILVDKQGNIILNGLGLHSFKKYLSLITSYSNKSIYTAVEHLRDRSSVVFKPRLQADIYSLGVIFYQIATKNRQYRELSLKDVQAKFSDQNFRPKIPENINIQVKNLIRKCWHEDAEARPSITHFVDELRKLVQD